MADKNEAARNCQSAVAAASRRASEAALSRVIESAVSQACTEAPGVSNRKTSAMPWHSNISACATTGFLNARYSKSFSGEVVRVIGPEAKGSSLCRTIGHTAAVRGNPRAEC